MIKYQRRQGGFTLIELLVVIAIISLLSSVVLASLNSARVKARDARRLADINQLRIAMNLYASDNNGQFPPAPGAWWCLGHTTATSCWNGQYTGSDSLNTALQPYISVIPDDPKSHGHSPSTCYGDAYAYSNNGADATLHWYYENASVPTATACLPGTYGGVNSCGNYCFLAL